MAQQADGTVYIDTLLDTTGFKAGGKDVEAAVRRMSKTVSGIGATAKIALQKQTDAFVKANQAYAQQEQKVDALKNKLKEMSEQKVATDEFKEIGKQIDNNTAKLNRLEKAQEEFLAVGGKESSSAYRRREIEIEELRNSIKYAKGEQEDLLNTGGAYKAVDTSGVEQKLFNEEQRLQNMNNSLATSYASLKSRVDSYSGSAINLASVKERLGKSFSSLLSTVKKTAKTIGGTLLSALKRAGAAMLNLHKNTKKSDRSIGSSLKTMLKYGLGIRSVFVLVNKLRRALVDGFKNLAQYDGRTNASISSLMSALTQLKNSFATAFAPILNVVAPILKTFINMIARAVTYVGMLIAALTGQDSFVRATEVQEDYAGSLGNTADGYKEATKAQNRYLSGLDEVRRWENPDNSKNANGDGSGYAAPTPSEMFETVPIENSLKNLSERIKKAWEKADFTALGTILGEKIRDGLDRIPWDEINKTVQKVGKSLATLINGAVEVSGLADGVGSTVGKLLNTGISGADAFVTNLHFDSLGDFVATAINSAISTINWERFGTLIRNGLNGIFTAAETWSGRFDFAKLGSSIKTLINSTLSGIEWDRAINAASKIGKGIATALNAVMTPETFAKIGTSVANAVRTVIAGVKSWVTSADFYTWGVSLGTALNNFFKKIDWKEVGLTLDGLIGGLVDFMKGLVDSKAFESFARKIGTALSQVNWLGHLFAAGRIIVEALRDIIVGAASTPAGRFIEALAAAFVSAKVALSILKSSIRSAIGTTVTGGVSLALSGSVGIIAAVISGGLIDAVAQVAVNEYTGGPKTAFQGIVDIVGGWFSKILNNSSVQKGINDFANGLNQKITGAFKAIGLKGGGDGKDETPEVEVEFVAETENFKRETQETVNYVNNTLPNETSVEIKAKDSTEPSVTNAKANLETLPSETSVEINAKDNASENIRQAASNIETSMSNAETSAKTHSATIEREIATKTSSAESEVREKFSSVESTSNTAWSKSSGYVTGSLNTMKTQTETSMQQIFKNVQSYCTSIYNTIVNNFQYAVSKAGIELGGLETSVSTTLGNITSLFTGKYAEFGSYGSGIMGSFKNGMESLRTSTVRLVRNVASDILAAVNIGQSMYTSGRNIIQSFINGLQSIRIPLPHITITTSTSQNGNTVTTSSNASVNWYKNGGLFDAPSVIGVGEAGKEAVLPIESRPVMTKLANSIVSGLNAATLKKVPIMATGTVTPPRAANSKTDYQHAIEGLNNLIGKINVPSGNRGDSITVRVPIILDGRQIFEAVIDEAKMKQIVSGRNPFEMA